jgi:phenylpropionate dioxygenase-like ring-hydroxylating dioxygenase large terminal subunit
MFLRNCWYAAGWGRDFAPEALSAVTILNEPIVIYRKADGSAVALEDRCCHRFAPLSMGRLEGDDLRCMYHGLKFGPSGKCIEIPGQAKIPPQAGVRRFPIVDKFSVAWIWMGDPALADEALIPDFVGVDDPRWAMKPGRMDYNANYVLINDNLLDLSHIAFLHNKSLGASFTPDGVGRPTVTKTARGVRISNWINSGPSKMSDVLSKSRIDIWQTYEFVIPGVFLLHADFYSSGTAAKFPEREPVDVEPMHRQFTCQTVTPLTDDRTCYFFAYGPWAKEPEHAETLYQLGLRAFNEDRVMIEAQQRNINRAPDAKMLTIAIDSGVAQFRRLMEDAMLAERQGQNVTAAAGR